MEGGLELNQSIIAQVLDGVAAQLLERPTIEQFVALIRSAQSESNELTQLASEKYQIPSPACARGCSHCCYLPVTVTPPELIALGAEIAGSFSPAQQRALSERINNHLRETSDLTPEERFRARIPCPLLSSAGSCSAYEARPFPCRGWHSFRVSSCEAERTNPANSKGPPYSPVRLGVAHSVRTGIDQATESAGLQMVNVDLVDGLKVVTEREDAASAWLSGEHVFQVQTGSEGPPSAR